MLVQAEQEGDFGKRLALLEEFKTSPLGLVWDQFCRFQKVLVGLEWQLRSRITRIESTGRGLKLGRLCLINLNFT